MTLSTKPPGGTRDFLPDDIRRREHVIGVVRGVYERYGFEPLETPAFENIETLLGKYGDEGNKLIFKILRRGEHEGTGEADLALRYDLTVPLARVIAQYQNELPRYFKRYQIQPVWRADRPARGRFREFYQCDIDAMGSTSPIVEVEQLAAVGEILRELGFSDFTMRLNHREVLKALLKNAEVPTDKFDRVLVVLDKLDKIGRDGVFRELGILGIGAAAQTRLFNWLEADVRPDWLDWLEGQFAHLDDEGRAGFQNLREILRLTMDATSVDFVKFHPSLARGLAYYTGAIMELTVPDLAGSLGGGGRYDNLIGMFLGRDVPACGFSLGLERILVVMTERGMFPPAVTGGALDVMVVAMDDSLRVDALAIAARLRAQPLRVGVFPEAGRKLDRPLKYAAGQNVPFLAILGQDERAVEGITIRDLRSREQKTMPRDEVGTWIAGKLGSERGS